MVTQTTSRPLRNASKPALPRVETKLYNGQIELHSESSQLHEFFLYNLLYYKQADLFRVKL